VSLFVFTAVGRDAAEHLADSVLNPVSPAKLGASANTLLGATVDPSNIRCWGSIPGERNVVTWEEMQPDDEILIYRGTAIGFTHKARVLDKIQDAVTARRIWAEDDSGSTWELMYFLEVEELDPPESLASVRGALGYGPKWFPRGFSRLRGSLSVATTSQPASTKPYKASGHVVPRGATPSVPDPDVVGRGVNAHRRLNDALAEAVSDAGLVPLGGGVGWPNVDLCWESESGVHWVAEVKSMTRTNETHQLRLGLGEVIEFRSRMKALLGPGATVRAGLIVETEPLNLDRWAAACASVDVELAWPENLKGRLNL
jgi:hypothetical protein